MHQADLWNTSFVVNTGNKIKVAVSSSNWPRFSVNPNNGLGLLHDGPNITAQNSVHMSPDAPSSMVLPMVKLSQMPEFHALDIAADAFGLTPTKAEELLAGFVDRITSLKHLPPPLYAMRGNKLQQPQL